VKEATPHAPKPLAPSADDGAVLRMLGCFPTSAGAVLFAAGTFYLSAGWRYDGLVFFLALLWASMLAGLGLSTMATGRRWMAVSGLLATLLSLSLQYGLHGDPTELEGWGWLLAGNAVGLAIGVAAIYSAFKRRPAR
jgi:hypothetical protein